MFQKKTLSLLPLLLLSLLTLGLWSSCEKYNSESVGSTFYPANSMVRTFTHPVYVEFSSAEVRVWGPYLQEVDYSIDGTQVSLTNSSDSLALFVYGYPAAGDSAAATNCNLTIESNKNFALYINKLIMRSQQQPAIKSIGKGNCYMVIPKSSKNEIYAVAAPSAIEHHGALFLTGEGELILSNDSTPYQRPLPYVPVALEAQGGLYCQYDLKLTLQCSEGDAMRVAGGPIRSSLGTWKFEAGQHAISNPSDSIVLIAGTYTGIARHGKFFDNSIGTVIRQAKVEALSGLASDVLDTLSLHQHYDSTYVSLQQQITYLAEADSTFSVAKKNETSSLAKFTPHYTMSSPWVLLTNGSLQASDTLVVLKK